MGVEHRVVAGTAGLPGWAEIQQHASERGLSLQLRMIDGELAFPGERPAEGWRELRVSTPGGMVTLRREADGFALVAWGNADAGLRQGWNALALAIAQLADGKVDGMTAAEFMGTAELPPAWRSEPEE